MKVKNISEKVIGVAEKVLMPGDEMEYKEKEIAPGLRVLADLKYISIEEVKAAAKKEPKAEEEPADTETIATVVETDTEKEIKETTVKAPRARKAKAE